MTPDEERWAEALAIERIHGLLAGSFVVERIVALTTAGDDAGATRFREIELRLHELQGGATQ